MAKQVLDDTPGKPSRAPRVSVICIFFQAERYFREAIDSVLSQDFGDFELLLVDDGSTDSGSAIAKDYEARDPRVRYLDHPEHENRGMSATRNLGLGEARGELVAFIDSDDRWHPSKLREQVSLIDTLPKVDSVGGSVNYWASHCGGKDEVVPTAHVHDRPIPPGEATLALYPLGKANAPSMSDLLFRRDSILKVGGFEEAFRGGYEDQAFLAKFYLDSTLYFTTNLWSDYRLHSDSCMAELNRAGSYRSTRHAFLEWFEGYVARSPHRDDERIERALKRALRRGRPLKARLADAARAVPFAVPVVRGTRAGLKRLRVAVAPGPAILMYHRIAEERFDPWALAVSPAHFADHLEWLSRNRTALPLAEFAELNLQGKLPRDAVAITFDDGYACNAETAAPLLERLRIPATIFISPELIARGREFWWDELERIVLSHGGGTLRLDGQDVHVGEARPDDADWPAGQPPRTPRQHTYRMLWSLLHAKDRTAIDAAMAQLRDQAGVAQSPRPTHRPLTPKEVRATASDLIAFGSHALTHPSLPRLTPGEQAREIGDSVEQCAALAGVRPSSFAYPYGDYDPALDRLVEKAGFLCACRADGSFVTRKSNRFALPRIHVGNSGSRQLAQGLGRP